MYASFLLTCSYMRKHTRATCTCKQIKRIIKNHG